MDESHFDDPGARLFKYCFFLIVGGLTALGIWQKEAILEHFSFREHGEARIVVYALPGTKVSLVQGDAKKREVGQVGRDGKFTLVEQGNIADLRVLLSHPYYFPEEKSFAEVLKGDVGIFQAEMVPLLGSVLVRSFPSGATVVVDDEEVGQTPWKKRDLREGLVMQIEARMPGYIPQYKEVVIQGGREEDVVFSLKSSESRIVLETNKEGFEFSTVRVFLDGELLTLEDQTLRHVRPGRHSIEVVAHDGLQLKKEINIKPGQTLRLKLPDWFVEDGG